MDQTCPVVETWFKTALSMGMSSPFHWRDADELPAGQIPVIQLEPKLRQKRVVPRTQGRTYRYLDQFLIAR